jgi:hypothetical protein
MLQLLFDLICILLSIAFFTIAERKVLASIQRRKGPNVTGFWGTLQAIADDLKLIFKEVVISVRANWIPFLAASSVTLLIGLLLIWVFIPFSDVNLMEIYEKLTFDYILKNLHFLITALFVISLFLHMYNDIARLFFSIYFGLVLALFLFGFINWLDEQTIYICNSYSLQINPFTRIGLSYAITAILWVFGCAFLRKNIISFIEISPLFTRSLILILFALSGFKNLELAICLSLIWSIMPEKIRNYISYLVKKILTTLLTLFKNKKFIFGIFGTGITSIIYTYTCVPTYAAGSAIPSAAYQKILTTEFGKIGAISIKLIDGYAKNRLLGEGPIGMVDTVRDDLKKVVNAIKPPAEIILSKRPDLINQNPRRLTPHELAALESKLPADMLSRPRYNRQFQISIMSTEGRLLPFPKGSDGRFALKQADLQIRYANLKQEQENLDKMTISMSLKASKQLASSPQLQKIFSHEEKLEASRKAAFVKSTKKK